MSRNFSARDAERLTRALALAENGMLTAAPNPRVGCAAWRDGKIIGEGWHRRAGEAHAEQIAAQQCGGDLPGAEVYINLEPCAHAGRTPSCAAMLVAARPLRVVAAMPDPNPQVAGRGMAMLRAAGIAAEFAPPESEIFQRALELNIGFVSRMVRNRPWVRIKIAATMDGKTALSSGRSRWISGAESRLDAHRLRARSCAVITGTGTALADNPQLTARGVVAPRQPLRVLAGGGGKTPARLRMFNGGGLLVSAEEEPPQLDGIESLSLPGKNGGVDLHALLRALAARGANEAMVEAGRRLCGAFVAEGLADEIVVYQSPKLFGGGMDMFAAPPPDSAKTAPAFVRKYCAPHGGDLKIIYESPSARKTLAAAICALCRG
ncbi:MAG: bifunctional diaminohydroxyphosphoribosylaminopyrimidine deaminase/5-amino-6-(5-phosphoribosylamino)uracil reductase RibD [Betaproteobacteria bacterium]|nr:bifunctional diaminohydroxyphosphoribosylaminopyrimidine deaminase/5-amino-6-(5-phosphoribosylamino)uracil reductase RibD [Betaproteobacteria bacterium]